LLTVVAIITILMALLIPAITSTQSALQITRGAQGMADIVSLSRQTALARNRVIALRIYRKTDATNFFAYQMVLLEEDGTEQARRLNRLPDGVVISGNGLHSMGMGATSPTNLPGGVSAAYAEVRFRRDGSVDLGSGTNWYVSIMRDSSTAKEVPENFVVIVLEPEAGTARILQP